MYIRKQFFASFIIFGTMILIANGCGSGDSGVKVSGSVVQAGKAQEGVSISFIPLDKSKGESKGAKTNSDGTFEVRMKPGNYTVRLAKWVDSKGNVPKNSDDPNEDFAQLEASGKLKQIYPDAEFKVDIPAEGKQLPPFEVK